MYGIYCTKAQGHKVHRVWGAANAVHPKCAWYNLYPMIIATMDSHTMCMVPTLRWLFFAGTNVWYFCRLAQKRKILYPQSFNSYVHYSTLEFVNPVPFCIQIAKFSTRKRCFKSIKSQKNVPANNCHQGSCNWALLVMKLSIWLHPSVTRGSINIWSLIQRVALWDHFE